MFPSIPKVPMLGGKLAAKKKLEFANASPNSTSATANNSNSNSNQDYRIQQLMHGGPVQRALKADLLLLKSEFERDLDGFFMLVDPNASGNGSGSGRGEKRSRQRLEKEAKAGTIFKLFKSTFQRTKFAIVHTRCCPPRCDTEAYIQLIYSGALDQLRSAFREYDENEIVLGRGNDLEKIFFFQWNAIFAIFALYTLYETNPLPDVPIATAGTTHTTGTYASAYNTTHGSKVPVQDVKATKHLLSAMPLGICAEQGGRKAHRRSYRSPIRIDPNDFSLVSRLRDLAFVWMDLCVGQQLELDCGTGTGTRTDSNTRSRSRMVFGLAMDCIHVIDRLQPSFQLSEYSGPASLEGLTGSAAYYHSVALKEQAEEDESCDADALELQEILEAASTRTRRLGQVVEESENYLMEELDITPFETSLQFRRERYDDILGKVATELARNKTASNPSRQLMAIQKMLQPTLDRRNNRRRDLGMRLFGQVRASLSATGTLSVGAGSQYNMEGETNEEDDEPMTAMVVIGPISTQGVTTSAQRAIPVSCPLSFNTGLKLGIEKALRSVLEIKEKPLRLRERERERVDKRVAAGKCTIVDERTLNHGADDWFFDDTFFEHEDEISAVRVDEEIDQEDDFSIGGKDQLKGLGALQQLLSFAKQNNKRKQKVNGGDKGVASKDVVESNESDGYESNDSDGSSVSGPGNRALQNLLETAAAAKKPKKRKRVEKKADDCISIKSIQSTSTFGGPSVAGPGQNALQTLLSVAVVKPPAKKKKTATPKASSSRQPKQRKRVEKKAEVESSSLDCASINSIHSATTFGGPSVTGPGQNALQTLLSVAKPPAKKKKTSTPKASSGRQPKQRKRVEKKAEVESSSLDCESINSIQNATTCGGPSVTGPGQNALQTLLSVAVAKPPAKKKKTATPKANSGRQPNKRKRVEKKVEVEFSSLDCASINSIHSATTCGGPSVTGPGQNALQTLLSVAVVKPPAKKKKTSTPKASSGRQLKQRKRVEKKVEVESSSLDCASINSIQSATTCGGPSVTGPGQNALQTLLSVAVAMKPPAKKKKTSTPKAKSGRKKTNDDRLKPRPRAGRSDVKTSNNIQKGGESKRRIDIDDVSLRSVNSLSTFGAHSAVELGQHALQSLLSKAAHPPVQQNDLNDLAHTCAENETSNQSKTKDGDSGQDSDSGTSVQESIATAGPGKNALDKLFSTLNERAS
jgi:hypothetical protein